MRIRGGLGELSVPMVETRSCEDFPPAVMLRMG